MATDEAKKWKARSSQVRELTLPSGAKAVIRRPRWMNCLRTGLLPNRMFQLVTGMESPKKTETGETDYRDTVEIMCAYAIAGLVSPKTVLENPKEDEISVGDIRDEDLLFIFQKVQEYLAEGEEGEGKTLETFREGSSSGDARPDGEALQPQTVGDLRS